MVNTSTQHKMEVLQEVENAKIGIDTGEYAELWQNRLISLILHALLILLTESIKGDRNGAK